MRDTRTAGIYLAGLTALGATVSGCANSGGPPAMAMPAGQTCQSVRAELSRLDARGIQSKYEALNRGQRLSPAAQAEVDRYNQLLNQYLGAQCHV
ncbi:MAG TPA: hypothetical protein VNK52_05115 [Hyphomicrobiaceae bacterium]|nr:hypothetical protein [Hyphomicrobiaceae bacterium]